MKRIVLALALAACSPASNPPSPPTAPHDRSSTSAPVPSTTRTIILIGTSDLHGHLNALPVFGGYMNNLREQAKLRSAVVLLVDAGDMFQGTLESNLVEGESIAKAYAALGYAGAAVGNHEFDFGPLGPLSSVAADHEGPLPADDPRGALRTRARGAGFPFLLANAMRKDQPAALADLAPILPRTVVTLGGVRIGLVGITSADTGSTTLAANVRDLTFGSPAVALRREAEALRREGATVVVGLAHLGSKCESFTGDVERDKCQTQGEIFATVDALPAHSVDAVVAGHTHFGVAHDIHGVPVVQSFSYGAAFGRIDLELDEHGKVRSHQVHPPRYLCPETKSPADETCAPGEYAGKPVVRDARVLQIAEAYAKQTKARRELVLGVTFTAPVTRSYATESPLGNLFAKLIREHAKADVALMNGGGLRDELPAGPLHYGQLFAAMPFDNRVAVASVSVDYLRELFVHNLQSTHGILSLDGLAVDARCTGGKLVVDLYRPNAKGQRGKKLAGDATLRLAASDFLLGGGDDFSKHAGIGPVTITDDVMRDVFESGLRDRGVLAPSIWFDPKRPHVTYPGARPVVCGAPTRP